MIDKEIIDNFQKVKSQWFGLLGQEIYDLELAEAHHKEERMEWESLPFMERYPPNRDLEVLLWGGKAASNKFSYEAHQRKVKLDEEIRHISRTIALFLDEILERDCSVFFDLISSLDQGELALAKANFYKCEHLLDIATNKLKREGLSGSSKAEIKKTANHERDLFMYKLAIQGKLWKDIRALVHERFKEYWLDSDSAAQHAVDRFIKRNKLNKYPPRKKGVRIRHN